MEINEIGIWPHRDSVYNVVYDIILNPQTPYIEHFSFIMSLPSKTVEETYRLIYDYQKSVLGIKFSYIELPPKMQSHLINIIDLLAASMKKSLDDKEISILIDNHAEIKQLIYGKYLTKYINLVDFWEYYCCMQSLLQVLDDPEIKLLIESKKL